MQGRQRITINADKCDGCGLCVKQCPVEIMIIDHTSKKVAIKNSYLCITCCQCIWVCPHAAVFMDDAWIIK
ncbi:Ferredoxin Fd3 [Spironucleus salmonicida]|nr:Ferredoxin Fd3 [Spironucleus salmonicida]